MPTPGFELPIPENASIMTVEEFHRGVLDFDIDENEGTGYYAVADGMSSLEVPMNNFKQEVLKFVPQTVTHVVWIAK
jgi:hypothetical protein